MPDILQDKITVTYNSESYTFKIPSIRDEVKIGSRIALIRSLEDPDWDRFSQGLDGQTLWALRACATFEVLLVSASETWPFSPAKKGEPVVDSSTFPADRSEDVLSIYEELQKDLRSFRSSRTANPGSPSA